MSRRHSGAIILKAAAGAGARRALPALLLGAALPAGGCNIITPAAYIAMGQPKAAARYQLEDRSTVVFVDDRENAIPANASRVRQEIADKVSKDLLEQKILTNVISPRDAMALARSHDRQGNLLSVEALGEAVGAQQVIYVEMASFRGSVDNQAPRPAAACMVKVVDVEQRRRLFPPADVEKASEEVFALGEPMSQVLYRSSQGRRQVEQTLADLMGDRVAKLFYKHVPEELGTRLNPK